MMEYIKTQKAMVLISRAVFFKFCSAWNIFSLFEDQVKAYALCLCLLSSCSVAGISWCYSGAIVFSFWCSCGFYILFDFVRKKLKLGNICSKKPEKTPELIGRFKWLSKVESIFNLNTDLKWHFVRTDEIKLVRCLICSLFEPILVHRSHSHILFLFSL